MNVFIRMTIICVSCTQWVDTSNTMTVGGFFFSIAQIRDIESGLSQWAMGKKPRSLYLRPNVTLATMLPSTPCVQIM